MGKQYIPGVSGLLTEQNPVDAPSNTLSEAENIVIEQGGKVQARHGFNINYKKNTTSFTDTVDYLYTSQYTNASPFIQLLEYKNSSDVSKTTLVVKQTKNTYQFNNYGVYKIAGNGTQYRFYKVDNNGDFIEFRTILQYKNILNVFNTKESIYVQTENGLGETNVDVLDSIYSYSNELLNPTFFDIQWPFFPEISYKLIDSQLFGNWLKGGKKCYIRMTFYREMGYTDKPNDNIYESEPSVPLLVTSFNKDCIPSIFFDFKTEKNNTNIYLKLNEFIKSTAGRKFGIRLYRTKIVDLNEEIPDEYFQCHPDIPFENFLAGLFNLSNSDRELDSSFRETTVFVNDTATERINYLNNEVDGDAVIFNSSGGGVTPGNGVTAGVVYYIKNRRIAPSGPDSLASFQIVNSPTSSIPINFETTLYNFGIKFYKSIYYYQITSVSAYSSYLIELNVGDIVSAIYDTNTLPFISAPTSEFALAPYRFKTTFNEIKNQDYYPTRFQVTEKFEELGSYYYAFKTVDYIFLFSRQVNIKNVLNTTDLVDNRIGITIRAASSNIYNFPKNGYIALQFSIDSYLGPLKSDKTYSYQIKELTVGTPTILQGDSLIGQTLLTGFVDTSLVDIGALVTGPGIQSGTTVVGKTSTTINLSQIVLSTSNDVNFTFSESTTITFALNNTTRNNETIILGVSDSIIPIIEPQSSIKLTDLTGFRGITRSFNIDLNISDSGLNERPRLYTDSNIDGAANTNTIVPVSTDSIKYKDFWVYSGIQKPLEAYLYVTKQPKVAQFKLSLDTTSILNNNTLSIQNFKSSNGQGIFEPITYFGPLKYFVDCPVFLNRDVQIYNLVAETNNSTVNYNIQTYAQSEININTNAITAVTWYNQSGSLAVGFTNYSAEVFPNNTRVSFVGGTGTLPSGISKGISYYLKYIAGSTSPTKYTLTAQYDGSVPISYLNAGSGTNYGLLDSKISNIYFNATIYEQSSLTLKLTSTSNVVYYVTIYSRPFYNRRGYYTKYLQNGTLDNRALEFDLSAKESNGVSIDSTTYLNKNFALLGDASKIYNIPGKSNNQAMYNGQIKGSDAIVSASTITFDSATDKVTITTPSAITGTILDSTIRFTAGTMPTGISANTDYYVRNVVVNSTTSFTFQVSTTPTGTILDFTSNGSGITYSLNASNVIYAQNGQDSGILIIRNSNANSTDQDANAFDIKSFPQPGFMFVQLETSSGVWSTALFSYSSNEPGYHLNSYRFNNVKLVAGASANILSTTTYLNSKKYFYAIKAATIEEIALYPYSEPPSVSTIIHTIPNTLDVTYDSTNPHFTVVPHKLKTEIPIATLAKDGNIQFYGADAGYAKSSTELLEDYTYSIVEQFNKELKIAGIKAFLFKGENAGEIGIVYPDGQKIEILNNYGNHEFFPNINNQSDSGTGLFDYYTLAERINNEYEEKNMIQWSRRNIPEITTGLLYKYLGKNDKQIIGMAANTDDLYIFKEDGIWRCTDSGSVNDFDLPVVSDYLFSNNFVCQSAGSIQEINDEIIFLSQYGFASIANGGIQIIDGSINRDIVNLVSVSPKDRIRSFVNESKNLYYCTLINETEPTLSVKSGTYVFNTRTRQWSFMDEEILTGIEDSQNKSVVAFRQRPVKAKRTATKTVSGRQIPVFDFTDSSVIDANGYITRAQETTPLDMFYIAREQYTNNVKRNAVDQYDFKYNALISDATTYLYKSGTNSFWFITESVPNVASDKIRDKFKSSAHIALLSSSGDTNVNAPLIDSYITLFANRTLFLQKVNSLDMYEIRLKKTDVQTSTNNLQVFFEFIGDTPSWFDALSDGNSLGGISDFRILAGIPVKITFNPESGSAPDTNKLFQEYMIHTETANKGAVMSFKTDSRSNLTSDRRFVYDAATTNRNVFRTYIPMNASRGRYLIRQIKHDLPLENLIITGQTVVMRDSGSTRVQKDKDNE